MLAALLALLFAVAETPSAEKPSAEKPAGQTGRVRIESSFGPSRDLVAQLIHLQSHNRIGSGPRDAFSLLLPIAPTSPAASPAALAPVAAVPAGRAVAAIYSQHLGYVALSRPFEVEAGKETTVSPLPPAKGRADFLLVLERPRPLRRFAGYDLQATLVDLDDERPADLMIPSAGRVYALWYDLPPGIHRLKVESPSFFLGDRMVELPADEVGFLSARLERRPDVKVRLQLPEKLRQAAPLTLEMRSLRPPAAPDPWPVAADAKEIVLQNVPPVDAVFTLRSPPWAFTARLDLRSGENDEIVFAPVVTEVFGNLTRGGNRASGEIAFKLAGQPAVKVLPDGLGRYQVSLWRQEVYEVSATVADREPFRQLVEIPLVLERLLDLDVPSARHRVWAVDRWNPRRRPPISQASYRFVDEEGRELQGKLELDGSRAELPPIGFGRVDLTVKATGYRDGRLEGLALWPQAPGADEIAWLEPVTSWVQLKLVDEETEPVAGAEVRVLRDALADEIAWEGKSDKRGEIRVPGDYAGYPVLVRSPGHAFRVGPLPDPGEMLPQWWLEPPTAGQETRLVVVDKERQPIADAEVLLGIEGVWLRGKSLGWLVGSPGRGARTNGDGELILKNLPPQFSLMASTVAIDPLDLGGYAQLATWVDFPAPRMLVVRALPIE